MKNNRSTSQGRAVISFGLSRECSLLPRRETQSRQSQTFRSPPFGGKKPPQVRGRSTFIIWYIPAKSQTYYRKACSEYTLLQTGFPFEFSRGFLVYDRHNGRRLGKGHGRESAYTSAFLPDARIHSAKHFCIRPICSCEDIRRFFCVFDQ